MEFWFSAEAKKHWWFGPAEFDQLVRDKFMDLYTKAKAGECDHWAKQPKGRLALVIMFDQFPRNMFRDQGRAFEMGERARTLCKEGVQAGVLDLADWTDHERMFLLLPLLHSEDIADQDQSIQFMTKYVPGIGKHAENHRNEIRQFGRFPGRNAALNRQSTPAEIEFLEARKKK